MSIGHYFFPGLTNPSEIDLENEPSPWRRAVARVQEDKIWFIVGEQFHHVRETRAVHMIHQLLSDLQVHRAQNTVYHDEKGKVHVFISFGSAHQFSLADKLAATIPRSNLDVIEVYGLQGVERYLGAPFDYIEATYRRLVRYFIAELNPTLWGRDFMADIEEQLIFDSQDSTT